MSAAKYSKLFTSFLSPDETDARKAQSIGNDTALMFLRDGDSRLVSDSSHRFNCSALLNNADIATTDRALPRQARTTAATNGRSAPSSGTESTDCVKQSRPGAGSSTRLLRTTWQYPPSRAGGHTDTLTTRGHSHNHDGRGNSRFSSRANERTTVRAPARRLFARIKTVERLLGPRWSHRPDERSTRFSDDKNIGRRERSRWTTVVQLMVDHWSCSCCCLPPPPLSSYRVAVVVVVTSSSVVLRTVDCSK